MKRELNAAVKSKQYMATPSRKDPAYEQEIIDRTGVDRRRAITQDVCVPKPIGCGQPAVTFRDALSRKEFTISGLCQKCQDAFFGGGDNE